MGLSVALQWRGPLASCNYGCSYCPFAKHRETAAERHADAAALRRFVAWVRARSGDDRLAILFTPYGEALVRRRYRDALAELARLPQVTTVAIQTNLSCRPDWLSPIEPTRLALWATWHPSECPRHDFLARCRELHRRGVRLSVGMVGVVEHADLAVALRAELPDDVYLWINARQDQRRAYESAAGQRAAQSFARIDPLFGLTRTPQPSGGRRCGAGETVVSIDGDGTIRRCHFLPQPIGQLYAAGGLEAALAARACSRAACRCFLGFAHLPHLGLAAQFGAGLLARVPDTRFWSAAPAD